MFATSRAPPAEHLSIKRNTIRMTDLFSVNAIQTYFSQLTLQKRGKGQRFTKGKGSRSGGTDADAPRPSCSLLWHGAIAPYLLSWESPRALKRLKKKKGIRALLPSVGDGGEGRRARGGCMGFFHPAFLLHEPSSAASQPLVPR